MSRFGVPKESLCGAVRVVDNLALRGDRELARSIVEDSLVQQIAHMIAASGKVEEITGEFSTQFRLTVYILSPDKLHEMIQAEALELSSRFRL